MPRGAQADLKPYDYMALVPIVEGAGGVMTDWRVRAWLACTRRVRTPHACAALLTRAHARTQGAPLRWRPSDPGDARGEVLAAGDAAAHTAALAVLQQRFR